MKFEVCCNTASDAFCAKRAGAHRVELCSALPLGGLTPSIGELIAAKAAGIEVMAMVRPREGGFCYNDTEFDTMIADTEMLLRHGADGIVFGILKEDGTVDAERCSRLNAIIGSKTSVFHRAIDVTPNWRDAINTLCSIGFNRILTSGQKVTAIEGLETLCEMIRYAADRIDILPGSGINLENATAFVRKTSCRELHVSMRSFHSDPSTATSPDLPTGAVFGQKYSATNFDSLYRLVHMEY